MIQFENACIVSDMPTSIHRDEQNRLHSQETAAIEWADGYRLYYYHGICVKAEIILHPEELTKKDWLGEKNLEIRRVIQEQMGDEFVKKIGGEIINKGKRGTLYEVDLGSDPEGKARYVRVKDSSTKREYYLRIPPTIQEADEGVAWTFGLSEKEYQPEKEA